MPKKSGNLQNIVLNIEKSRKSITDSIKTITSITESAEKSISQFSNILLPDLSPLSRLDISDSILKLKSSLMQPMQSVVSMNQGISNLISEALSSFNNQWMKQFADFGKRIEKILFDLDVQSAEIAPKLQKANLWISPNMSFELIHETITLCKNSESTSQDIHSLYIDHYSKNEYDLLKSTVDSWKINPFFSDRFGVINDALEAHIAHKYSLSIPALLLTIEGIVNEITGKHAGHPSKRLKEAVGEKSPEFLSAASKEVFLNLLDEIGFFGNIEADYFTSRKYSKYLVSKGINEEECLNRHAIFHGVQKKYASEINSLKAFLILDMLSDLEKSTEI